jgi:hypothetical protein
MQIGFSIMKTNSVFNHRQLIKRLCGPQDCLLCSWDWVSQSHDNRREVRVSEPSAHWPAYLLSAALGTSI